MFECGDASSVDGGEVNEEYVEATGPTVRVLGSALDVSVWCVLSEKWRCDFSSCVPLAEVIVDHVDRRGRLEAGWVVVVVCMVVGNECCEVGVVVYVKDSDRVK